MYHLIIPILIKGASDFTHGLLYDRARCCCCLVLIVSLGFAFTLMIPFV